MLGKHRDKTVFRALHITCPTMLGPMCLRAAVLLRLVPGGTLLVSPGAVPSELALERREQGNSTQVTGRLVSAERRVLGGLLQKAAVSPLNLVGSCPSGGTCGQRHWERSRGGQC